MSKPPPMADATPSDCERIIIVGAGGFGREIFQWARATWPAHQSKIAGFLSDDPRRLDSTACRLPILADPAKFSPQAGDYLLLAIGIPGIRRQVAEDLRTRGGKFLTMIHPTAVVAESARIDPGTVICPYAIVSDSSHAGRFTLLNYHSSMAHDSITGDYAVLSPYAALGGGATAAEDSFLGLHATIGPGKSVGARSKVSANSCVLSDVPANSIIFGVPGTAAQLLMPSS